MTAVTDLRALLDRPGDWHLHTTYTDGQDTVEAYCEQAVENGLELLVFSEHTRRELDYDYAQLRADVERARERYDLQLLLGCEAKVLGRDGRLDVPSEVSRTADVVVGVFHRFPETGKTAYLDAAAAMLANSEVDVWGHPTLYAERTGITLHDRDVRRLARIAADNGVLFERNQRYDLPDERFVRIARSYGVEFVVGSDAHKRSQLLTKDGLAHEQAWLAKQY